MSEPLPDRIIVQDRETGKFLLCALALVEEGVAFYAMIPGRNYEFKRDAIRGAHYKPQAQEEKAP